MTTTTTAMQPSANTPRPARIKGSDTGSVLAPCSGCVSLSEGVALSEGLALSSVVALSEGVSIGSVVCTSGRSVLPSPDSGSVSMGSVVSSPLTDSSGAVVSEVLDSGEVVSSAVEVSGSVVSA